MASAYVGSSEYAYEQITPIRQGSSEYAYTQVAGNRIGSSEYAYSQFDASGGGGGGGIPPIEALVDTATATSVSWYHENRLYVSFAGKTYCRDMLDPNSGWSDCGYGYVNARVVISRFNFPNIAFLAANLTPRGYGDRTFIASLTHRSLTPDNLNVDVVPNKIIKLRPFAASRDSRSLAKKLKAWGSFQHRGSDRRVGKITCTSDTGYTEEAFIYKDLYEYGLVLEQDFSPAMLAYLLNVDIEFFENVVDAEWLQTTLEFQPES